MKRSLLPLFAALLAVCGSVQAADDDTAHGVKGALLVRNSIPDPDSFHLSRVLVARKFVCIEYQRRNKLSTGTAVYQPDEDLLWIDNSWIWQRNCLVGKMGQHRDGKDVTKAVTAALNTQPAIAAQPAPVIVQQAPAVYTPAPVIVAAAPSIPPTAPIAKPHEPVQVKAIPAVHSTTAVVAVAAPVATSPRVVAQSVQPVASPVPIANPTPPPAQVTVAATVPATVPITAARATTPVFPASGETSAVHGVTIIDNNAALEKNAAAPAESLGDAARRLRKTKQQTGKP